MMNKRGQSFGLALVTAIIIFSVGMLSINILKPEIDVVRDATTGLDCAATNASTLSDGTKLTCLAIDATIPYFMIIIVATAGGLITSRLAGGKGR